jgi:quinol monooxygenase YgiN
LYRNNQDPQDFTFVEEWTDDSALERHLQTPHLQSAAVAFSRLVEGAPSIGRYSLIA